MIIIRRIIAVIVAVWRTLASISFVVSILFLWPDIQELPTIYPRAFGWLQMLERETLLGAALGLAVAWILWMDVRHLVRSWIQERHKHPLQIIPFGRNTTESLFFSPVDGTRAIICKNVYVLGVRNESLPHETIRNVQVQLGFVGRPIQLAVEIGRVETTDIQPGVTAYFRLGYVLIDGEGVGVPKLQQVSTEQFAEIRLMPKNQFNVQGLKEKDDFTLHFSDEKHFSFNIIISADGQPLNIVRVKVLPSREGVAMELDESFKHEGDDLAVYGN